MVFTAGQRSIMAEIIGYYGHESQKMMLLEEMSELQKEICKDMRYDPDLEAITEEVADVLIMLEQIQMMYHISETKLHKITNEKLHRQLRRIEDEKSGIIRRISTMTTACQKTGKSACTKRTWTSRSTVRNAENR